MQTIPLGAPLDQGTERCECACCGAHVQVVRSWQLAGQCRNCRSYDLVPLATVQAPPPAVPPMLAVPLPQRWAA